MAGVQGRTPVTDGTVADTNSVVASTFNGKNENNQLLESSASSSGSRRVSGAPVRPPGTSAVVFAAELDGVATDFAVLRYR